MASLQIRGERTSGADVRQQNTMAALAIANVLKVRFFFLDGCIDDTLSDALMTPSLMTLR